MTVERSKRRSYFLSLVFITKSNNIVWLYPERALQKAISKSTVKTAIALGRKHVPRACFYICFQSNFLNKLRSNLKDK